jgi:pilus assembly protein CpaC
LTFEGYTIPALTTRKVQTEVELESGQSFVIAGLLDKEMTETFNKMPGLANIPLLGKLFQSRARTRDNTELLVIVTPEVVRPMPTGRPAPELDYPQPFLKDNTPLPMRQPGIDKTGPVAEQPRLESIPVEQLVQSQKQVQAAPTANAPVVKNDAVPAEQPAARPVQASPPGSGPGGNDK